MSHGAVDEYSNDDEFILGTKRALFLAATGVLNFVHRDLQYADSRGITIRDVDGTVYLPKRSSAR